MSQLSRSPESQPKSSRIFWRHWLHHLPVICGLTLLMAGLSHLHWLDEFEMRALDTYLLSDQQDSSANVVLVTISDEDFQSRFEGESPLHPETLGTLLTNIAAAKPQMIVVDLDTTSAKLRENYHRLYELSLHDGWPPVLWSIDGVEVRTGHGDHGPTPFQILPPLGGGLDSVPGGMIVFPADTDGVVRRHIRTYPVALDQHKEPKTHDDWIDSLPWAVIRKYCQLTPAERLPAHLRQVASTPGVPPQNEVYMNFAGNRFSFFTVSTGEILANRPGLRGDNSPLHGKIILLAGNYRSARDLHPTPYGTLSGGELLARMIETELRNLGVRPIHEMLAMAIDVLFATILVYLNWRFPSPRAGWISLAGVIVLALVASFLTFHTLGLWVSFAIVLLGVWLHCQFDTLHELYSLRHEVEELRHNHHLAEQSAILQAQPDQNQQSK